MITIFAENLNRIMKEKDFTCTTLAKAGGFSKGSVSGWMNGVCSPKPGHIEVIAETLGVSVDELTAERAVEDLNGGEEEQKVPRRNTLTPREAAALLHKTEEFIRQGLQEGRPGFEYGAAVKTSTKWSFCIYAYKFSEITGIPMADI